MSNHNNWVGELCDGSFNYCIYVLLANCVASVSSHNRDHNRKRSPIPQSESHKKMKYSTSEEERYHHHHDQHHNVRVSCHFNVYFQFLILPIAC